MCIYSYMSRCRLVASPGQWGGACTIQLSNSAFKPGGGGVPVARKLYGGSGNVSTGYVTFLLPNSRFVSRSRTVPKESDLF